MDGPLAAQHDRMTATERDEASRSLKRTLGELLGLSLPDRVGESVPAWAATHRVTVSALRDAISRLDVPERAAITELAAALVRTAGDPLGALVTDVAEILYLPRNERSEYRLHRLPSPPFVIEKILLEYAIHAIALDGLMARLNKPFCATRCPKPPVGCCHLLGYDLGLVPDRMLEVQRLEARRNGWTEPAHPDLDKCRYHTPTGCALRLFKSPACIGAMCEAVERHLDETYPPEDVALLRDRLRTFRNCDIDRTQVFEAMRSLAEAGRRF